MSLLPNVSLTDEERSRLLLWNAALRQAGNLLRQAERAREALTSEEVQTKDKWHAESALQFARSKEDYAPGLQKLSHIVEHEALIPRKFADSSDCLAISDSCQMLAVIFVCQLFKSGNAEIDNVAGNNREFVEAQLEHLLSIACMTSEEKHSFRALRKLVEKARDKMLAHADASAFEVRSIEIGISHKLHTEAINGIDFASLALAVQRLQQALRLYLFEGAA